MRARFENTITALVMMAAMGVLAAVVITVAELTIVAGPWAGATALILFLLISALVSDLVRSRK